MIHSARDGLSQNRNRSLNISWRSPYQLVAISAGKLHGTVTHPVYGNRCSRQSEGAGNLGLSGHLYILTLIAIGELVNDKLPKTPSRLIPPQFITRIVMSALCDLAIGLSGNAMIIGLVRES